MKLIPYVSLDGQAEEAMNFYATAFGGEVVQIQRYADAPGMQVPQGYENKVLHGRVKFGGDNFLYFSDVNRPVEAGNSVSLSVEIDTEAQINHAFETLSSGGEVFMQLQKTFWGALYGKLTDKFGVQWDLNHQLQAE